jgi:hypothetical protein
VQEQTSGIGQVNQAVAQLDRTTQQNSALVEESTAAAQSLSDQAQRLAHAMQRFRIARPGRPRRCMPAGYGCACSIHWRRGGVSPRLQGSRIPRPAMLRTESPRDDHVDLDLYPTPELLQTLVDDQLHAVQAVRAAAPALALPSTPPCRASRPAAGWSTWAPGTSGRLGVLDSVELNPTFSWPRDRAPALIAGGHQARCSKPSKAPRTTTTRAPRPALAQVGPDDVVLLIAASGTTPYVLGALQAAQAGRRADHRPGNNPGTPLVPWPRSASRWTPGPSWSRAARG